MAVDGKHALWANKSWKLLLLSSSVLGIYCCCFKQRELFITKQKLLLFTDVSNIHQAFYDSIFYATSHVDQYINSAAVISGNN